MSDARLELALERIGPGDWEAFEKFAAEFLVARFPDLRTTASPHGDRGRDGQLYVVGGGDVTTAFQYSVSVDWKSKIARTVKTLKSHFPELRELIYATSQRIGPDADELRSKLWQEHRLSLDICDRPYFLERQSQAPSQIAASEDLIDLKVRPLLVDRRVIPDGEVKLGAGENRIALLHLSLDASDEASQKGLTKSSFDALVRSALHGSNVDAPVELQEVVRRVQEILPAGHDQQVTDLVGAALARLSRKNGPINKLGRADSFHVSFKEEQRIAGQTSQFLVDEAALEDQLHGEIEKQCGHEVVDLDRSIRVALRLALESILIRKGELFADATVTGAILPIDAAEIVRAVQVSDIPEVVSLAMVAAAASAVLERPEEGVKAHLRRLADAYTLFAFLRQAPDVQKVITKIFSDGEVWLDTNVVLPILAETLITDASRRPFTTMLNAAQIAGLKLFVTDGVIEEVERHLNRCLAFSKVESGRWRGRVPYVYAAYSDSGKPRSEFESWIEEFRGAVRPEEDVRVYLETFAKIKRRNLKDYSDAADERLRGTIQELWSRAHDRRRVHSRDEWDQGTVYRLVEHDVENCVGVLETRKRSSATGLGYRQWWLTLDKVAFGLTSVLREEYGREAPLSPAMSPDYLVQTLRIGPIRTAVADERRVNLPLLADFSRLDVTPRELIESADTFRASLGDASEHVIQRRVRDHLDTMRASYGTAIFEKSVGHIEDEDDDVVSARS